MPNTLSLRREDVLVVMTALDDSIRGHYAAARADGSIGAR